MKCYTWDGLGGYDGLLCVNEKEARAIISHYGTPDAAGKEWEEGYFYLLCDKKRILTPLPFLALAFGGQYNGDLPYGGETACHFSLDTISEYRLETDWKSQKKGLYSRQGSHAKGSLHMNRNDRIRITKDALLGQAIGDAFGVPVEFLSRDKVRSIDLHDMVGVDSKPVISSRWGNTIPKGCWSDDTSMTIASMSSFINNQGRIDYEDQLHQFVRWWETGEYCCYKYPFGLGGNISDALKRHRMGCPALMCGGRQIMDNGNGALMRILPFSLYCVFHQLSYEETAAIAGNGSAITHGHEISRICCFIWTEYLRSICENANIETATEYIENLPFQQWFSSETIESVRFIADKKVRALTEDDIGQTGYVVDTLYSALFSLYHSDSFEEAIKNAINLGYDTDTAGAVTGSAAGIIYGAETFPARWIANLRKRDDLEDLAQQFAECFLN